MNSETGKASPRQSTAPGPHGTQVINRDQISELHQAHSGALKDDDRARLIRSNADGNSHADLEATVHVLHSDRMTIGRSGVCDIRIEEPSISSEHARLVRSEDGWRIINLLSTNGVFINDEKVFSHRLQDQDTVRLGRVVLRFQEPQAVRDTKQTGSTRAFTWLGWVAVSILLIGTIVWLLRY
ncbi:MAG: FHA domain-containing protein [Xanthomonadaceae bacterium]|nr:FHA domain-containing protein [Xanthomonadaceae bacterium]